MSLKPCPWCGSTAKPTPFDIIDGEGTFSMQYATWRVACTNPECQAIGPWGGKGSGGQVIAVTKWDARK